MYFTRICSQHPRMKRELIRWQGGCSCAIVSSPRFSPGHPHCVTSCGWTEVSAASFSSPSFYKNRTLYFPLTAFAGLRVHFPWLRSGAAQTNAVMYLMNDLFGYQCSSESHPSCFWFLPLTYYHRWGISVGGRSEFFSKKRKPSIFIWKA